MLTRCLDRDRFLALLTTLAAEAEHGLASDRRPGPRQGRQEGRTPTSPAACNSEPQPCIITVKAANKSGFGIMCQMLWPTHLSRCTRWL